ncbi:Alpha/Beta hydrolase protein [Trichoderma sp. SZMC 28015]
MLVSICYCRLIPARRCLSVYRDGTRKGFLSHVSFSPGSPLSSVIYLCIFLGTSYHSFTHSFFEAPVTHAKMSDTLPSPSTTPDGLEPRFSLPLSTPRSSKTSLAIGGVTIYVYGLEQLQQKSGVNVAVLYLAHNRTRTYLVTEGIAHEILHRYRSDGRNKKVEMIAITMNMRNHGDRQVSPEANLTWSGGNENHAVDLLSMISGATQDFKLVLDFLPAYFPQFNRMHNIMLGVSLGAHTAWRMASAAPGQFDAYAMVVGCPNLTSLLLERLGIDASALGVKGEELETVSYDQLEKLMDESQRRRWPRALAELIREGDRKIYEEFPSDVPLFMCNGEYDKLVPARYTTSWLERRSTMRNGSKTSKDIKPRLFIQENTGHSCTKEMVAMLADWLGDLYKL